jgi:predicted alpha-1,2-mannosidase
VETAYEAMRKGATTPGEFNLMRPDVNDYFTKGYVPLREQYDNSVSHALEYYIADWNLSKFADALGKKEDAKLFYNRSMGYKHYYSKEFGTLRPILPDGTFYSPFDPKQGENFEPSPGFHEGNAWNYTFYVPHDINGLAKLMGGKKKFVDRLQMVFDKKYYDMANEPDIAYPYLFSNFKGEEWRTQKIVRQLLTDYYHNAPKGIPGNDDTGTMSAWAVFSMMGFYPACPGDVNYTLTSPLFDKVTLKLNKKYYPKGELVIGADRKHVDEIYIHEVKAGNNVLKNSFISHDELVNAGLIQYKLKDTH